MDSVSQSPQLRQCDSKDQCLQADKYPDGWMPESEFYKSRKNRCKKCHQHGHKPYETAGAADRKKAGHEAELMAVEKFRSLGYYAAMGKDCKQFKHTDLVLLGCVRCECKIATLENSQCTWSFSSQRVNGGFKADLILLMMNTKTGTSFHLFPAGHPVFYKRGRVKIALQYLEYVHHRKRGEQLTPAIMNEYKDAWHLIDKTYKEISELLKDGKYEPKMAVQPMPMQPRLFDLDMVA